MNERQREHFDGIAGEYREASASWQTIYEQLADRLNPLVRHKEILDVGNGGHFAYDTALPRRVTAMDVSPSMLERIDDPRVAKVVGDARELPGVEDGSLDAIVFSLCLHHITGNSVGDTVKTLERILTTAQRKIRPGGHLLVAEPVLPVPFYWIESLLFPVTRRFLDANGVPMIFFFSFARLLGQMARNLGIRASEIQTTRIRIHGSIDPLGGSFPGWISIPAWLHPLRYHLFVIPLGDQVVKRVRRSEARAGD